MAKGLRSKGKRANRAQLRKTLVDPIIKKRVETLHKALKERLKESREGISNFDSLKSAFQAASSGGDSVAGDMAIEEEEEEQEEEEEGEEFKSKRTIAKEEFIKKRGSKARINPGKQLVWFK
jgi:ribosomal protein L12E/L44/L45/RPP1/RPP2